ncbi:hypothetical protein EU537_02165 [Candidatus Thorarchaeota archaeon]|nr:MAG: hypothetical protein EU537_02165 [Candidatus Thorarchaeota archaeon]
MLRRKTVASALFIVLSSSFLMPAFAQTHNLEWGVEVGEQFTYALQRKTISPALEGNLPAWMNFIELIDTGEKVQVNVTHLYPIPEEIESSEDAPISYCDVLTEDNEVVLAANSTAFLFPIGDWEFLTDLLSESAPQVELIDTDEEWGTIQSGQYISGDTTVDYYLEWRYEKENGTLNYLKFTNTVQGANVVDIVFVQWHPGMATVLPPDTPVITILLVALGIAFGVIAAIIVYKWYRGRKPLVQQLGE